jgi:hypothetical protein
MKSSRNPLSRSLISPTFHRTDPALPFMLFGDDDGAGGGGGNSKPPVVTKESIDALVEAKVASVLASNKANGDKDEALKILARSLHTQTSRAEVAETGLADANKNGISDADKADLAALRELGIKPGEAKAQVSAYQALGVPDELKKRLESGDEAIQKRAELERAANQAEAAKLLEFSLTPLVKKQLGEAVFEFEGSGQDRKVKGVKEGDKVTPFADYLKTQPELDEAISLVKGVSGNGGEWGSQPSGNEGKAPSNAADAATAAMSLYN